MARLYVFMAAEKYCNVGEIDYFCRRNINIAAMPKIYEYFGIIFFLHPKKDIKQ